MSRCLLCGRKLIAKKLLSGRTVEICAQSRCTQRFAEMKEEHKMKKGSKWSAAHRRKFKVAMAKKRYDKFQNPLKHKGLAQKYKNFRPGKYVDPIDAPLKMDLHWADKNLEARVLKGLLDICEFAMPDSYFHSDQRVKAAQERLAELTR